MSEAVRNVAPASGKGRGKRDECGPCVGFTEGKKNLRAKSVKRGAAPANDNGQPTILPIPGSQEAQATGNEMVWDEAEHAARNYSILGRRLAEHGDLFRRPHYGDGLVLAMADGTRAIVSKGADLAPIIVDRVPVIVVKEGKIKGNKVSIAHLNAMVRAESFLSQFRTVDFVTRTPMFLPDWTLTKPGFNDGGDGHRILYVGDPPAISGSMDTITEFLGVMDWDSTADRTNTVAAALTVQLRNHWLGGKPITLATANKSHAGKDTLLSFASGTSGSVSISYEGTNWALESSLVKALKIDPDAGMVVIENARLDGHDKRIASAIIERFATDPNPLLFSTGSGGSLRIRNDIVLAISTNYGLVSEDIMNRALPIRLNTVGNVADRHPRIGNPRHDFLPANREQIAAELRGMIVRWVDAGRPLDTNVRHPFAPWARTIGGILKVNGLTDFLANYGIRKSEDDPIRKGLGLLGAAAKLGDWWRPADWAKMVVDLGLKKSVIPAADQENETSQARGVGVVLSTHRDETIQVETDAEKLTLRLEKKRSRFDEREPHVRYRFVEVSREPIPEDDSEREYIER